MPFVPVQKRGFTLIELLVVIAILGILAAAVLVAINPGKRAAQSRDAIRKQDLASIYNSLIAYSVEHGVFPTTSAGPDFVLLSDEVEWFSELASDLKKVPVDPRQSGLPDYFANSSTVYASSGQVLASFSSPAIDNTSGPVTGTSSVLTWDHEVLAQPGENTLLVVTVSARGTGEVDTITYGSQALSRHDMQFLPSSGPTLVEIWYLKQPEPGEHDIELNWDGSAPVDGVVAGASSWKYVDQGNSLGTVTEDSPTGTSGSINVTYASEDDVILDVGSTPTIGSGDAEAGAEQVELYGESNIFMIGYSSYRSASSGNEMTWQGVSVNDTWNMMGVPIKASSDLPIFSFPTPADESAANCPTIEDQQFWYCYAVSETGSNFTIWGRLEIEDDPDIWFQPGAKCRKTPPTNFYNYCVGI